MAQNGEIVKTIESGYPVMMERFSDITKEQYDLFAVKDETYMDAFKDLSVYGVIAQLVAEKVWGK